jgi:WD40 repeat protein
LRDKTALLWDAEGKWLATLEGHTNSIRSAMFSPDGSRILTASDDKTARLWDAQGKWLATLEGHTGIVLRAVFSRDGSRILTAADDMTARAWNAEGKWLATLEEERPRGRMNRFLSALFSPDGSRILTRSLLPHQSPPCAVIDNDRDRDAADLLRRMLAAGLSEYEPDPLAALGLPR